MTTLDLSPAELGILEELLRNDLMDLRMEIADTDLYEYRERLRRRKAVIEKTLAALTERRDRAIIGPE